MNRKKTTPRERSVEALGAQLLFSWQRYTEFFGEPPHGTMKQLMALAELMVPVKKKARKRSI